LKNRRPAALLLALALLLCPLAATDRAENTGLREAFLTAAFRPEYGAAGDDALRRWAEPLRVFVGGEPTREDLGTLRAFLKELADKVDGLPEISVVPSEGDANLTVWYAPLDRLADYEPSYVSGNWGYFAFWWDGAQQIVRVNVVIASDVTDLAARNHLLLEEITGGLGLSNDIGTHEDSILYQPWTATQRLSELDWRLLNLLYDRRLRPGMDGETALKALGL